MSSPKVEVRVVSKLKAELPRADAQRLAAALLYARGTASAAYAEARRADAVARADRDAAEYWSSVQAALLAMTVPLNAGFGADWVPPPLLVHDLRARAPADSPEPIARPSE